MPKKVGRNSVAVPLGTVSESTVRVASTPFIGALLTTLDAIGVKRYGAPRCWQESIAASLPASATVIHAAFSNGPSSFVPDCLVPHSMADAKLDEQIEDVAELSPDILAGELNAAYPDQLPAHWRPAAERPKRWLRRYVEVLRAAYGAYEPLWSSKRALFDREAERVGVAAVRGYVAELADTLSPLVRVDGQHLRLPGNAAERVRMTGRSLVLCPMVAGPKALAYNLGAAGQVWLAYPLSGLGDNLRTTASTTGMDYLATLLGTVRARLLALIDRPCNAGQLATAMNCSPSVITHHCDRLEAAGLVSRERRGREIRVERTARGEQLLDLYVHEHLTIC